MTRSSASVAIFAFGAPAVIFHPARPACAQQAQTPAAPMSMQDNGMLLMSSSVDVLSPMTSEASGTAWLPSSSPMYGKMLMYPNGNMLMLHGAADPRYTETGSARGDHKVDAPNWFMGMFGHPLDQDSQLGLRAMISLDALTEGGAGYPLLFQTGETWHGVPLHDHQHPHDLFSELSADYSRKISENISTYTYLGYPGEPALGPPTYMHRLIAYDLPDAPIGHHWQDSTHITFGVATVGVNFANRWKFETSDFTGREPDENRYNFERPRFDSNSGRVSYNLDAHDSFQVSYGSIKNPEGDGMQQHRITSSWIYNQPLGADSNFTTTLVWGQNVVNDEANGTSNSFLEEADYQCGRNALFTRWEQVQKSGTELVLPGAAPQGSPLYGVGAYTVGYLHDLSHGKGIDTGVGGAVTVNTKPSTLDAFYGRGTPVGFQVIFRLRPSRVKMEGGMAGMGPTTAMGGMSTMPGMGAMPGMGGSDRATDATFGKGSIALETVPNPAIARKPAHLVVTILDAEGNLMTDIAVNAAANMATMDMGTEKSDLTPIFGSPGKFEGDLTFTMAGPWRVTVTVTSTDEKHAKRLVRDIDVAVAK